VIYDEIHDNPDAALLGLICEIDKITGGAMSGVDSVIIGNVITTIKIRGWLKWLEPETSDAEAGKVIEASRKTFKVPDTVTVRIHKRANVETVNNRVFIPEIVDHRALLKSIRWNKKVIERFSASASLTLSCGRAPREQQRGKHVAKHST